MPRRFTGSRLVVASHNKGKLVEIAELLRPLGIEAVWVMALKLPEPEEIEDSFAGNAALKALAAARGSGLPALADDSGLAVEALGGAPGIYSARWAGPTRDFSLAMRRVEQEVSALGIKSPRAAFICALALAWPDGHIEATEGRVEGTLTFPPRGRHGFGYDPIFVPLQNGPDGQTFGEMDPDKKHAISHRADAFRKLLAGALAR
jgi:XTP/dITP diphosphohydrolase